MKTMRTHEQRVRGDAATIGQRIEWLLKEASQSNGGSERECVIVYALLDAAKAHAQELARL